VLSNAVSSVHLRFCCYGEGRSATIFIMVGDFFLGRKKENGTSGGQAAKYHFCPFLFSSFN